jgi:mannose-6-phosphate isomerase-like protein (cupin superfamily)
MSDVTIKRIEEFDSPNRGGFCRARASLGVTAFGMQVENFPPNFEHFPEHDHTHDGQEEVYTALSGSATLHAGGEDHVIEPGVFARVGPGVRRKITTGDSPVQLLCLGATPGEPYSPPAFTEVGAAMPG